MDLVTSALILILVVVGAALLYWLAARVRSGRKVNLRPLIGYVALQAQSAKSIETGLGVHLSVGRADLSRRS